MRRTLARRWPDARGAVSVPVDRLDLIGASRRGDVFLLVSLPFDWFDMLCDIGADAEDFEDGGDAEPDLIDETSEQPMA